MSNRPVLLLGLDGLGQEFLDSPLTTAAAPNLCALLRDSGVAPLRSTFPPYTAPAWTSITTGVDPGRHGVFGFTDAEGHAVSDASVAAPRLWDHVGRAGGRSVVINMPITYPPRPIEGVMVSGMPVPPGAAYVCGTELDADYVVDIAVREDGQEHEATIDRLAAMTDARGRAAVRLATTESWDLFVAVFVLPDRLGHPWWKYLVPGDALFDTAAAERARAAAARALAALDRAVSDLIAALPSATAVVTCSDHGFGTLRADYFLDVALAAAGFIDAPAGSGLIGRLGRSALGQRLPAAVRRTGRRATEARTFTARTATPYECGVRLADPAVADAVTDLLYALRDPDDQPLVTSVRRREDLYDGPHVDRAPDLLVELTDESVDLHDGLHAASPWVSRADQPWGTHRADGILAVTGGAAPTPTKADAADVAGIVLDLLGIDAAGELHTSSGPVYTDDEEAAVLEHLKGLGYVD